MSLREINLIIENETASQRKQNNQSGLSGLKLGLQMLDQKKINWTVIDKF
jgi:hypothetical protein